MEATRLIFENPQMTERATLVYRSAGARNEFGEWVAGEEHERDVNVAPEPLDLQTLALLGGTRLDGQMRFYMLAVDAAFAEVGSSRIVHRGAAYLVDQKRDWSEYVEVVANRQERQTT